jgi:hypothetical protein
MNKIITYLEALAQSSHEMSTDVRDQLLGLAHEIKKEIADFTEADRFRCDESKRRRAAMEAKGDFDKEEFGFAQELIDQYGGDLVDDDAEVYKIQAKDLYVVMKMLGYGRKPVASEPLERGDLVTVEGGVASKAEPFNEKTAAVKTLKHLGYTYHGAELWKPPLGKVPKFEQATPERLHLFEFWWESHMPQATQSQAWAAWAAAQSSKGATIDAAQATPRFDDCAKSPTGKHSESWFGNGDCEHCKSGAQIAPMVSATPEPRLFIGACITDGRLHATVQRLESNGDVTLVATAKMDAASLHGHDCIAQMTPVAPTQQAAGEPVGFALVPMTEDQVWHNDSIMSANAIGGLKMDAVMRIVRGVEAHHSARLAAAQAKEGA